MSKTKSNQSWDVKGLIIGPRLPSTNFQIGDCTIRPLSKSEEEYFKKLHPPILKNPLTSNMGAFHLPTRLHINSQHTFSFKINATSQDDALAKSQEKLVGIIGALTLGTGSIRYIAKCLYAHQPEAPDFWSVPSGVGSFFLHDPSELEESDKALIQKYYTVADNKIVAKCFHYLNNAWSLTDAITSAPVHKSILLNYFLVLETISDAMSTATRKERKKQMIKDKAKEIRDFIALSTEDKDEILLEKFRKTINNIREIDIDKQSLEIEHSGNILKLRREIINEALKYNDFRNKFLSHPSSRKKLNINYWLTPSKNEKICLSEKVCREYISAYINFLNNDYMKS